MGHNVLFLYYSNRWRQRESERGVCFTEGNNKEGEMGYKLIDIEERLLKSSGNKYVTLCTHAHTNTRTF